MACSISESLLGSPCFGKLPYVLNDEISNPGDDHKGNRGPGCCDCHSSLHDRFCKRDEDE